MSIRYDVASMRADIFSIWTQVAMMAVTKTMRCIRVECLYLGMRCSEQSFYRAYTEGWMWLLILCVIIWVEKPEYPIIGQVEVLCACIILNRLMSICLTIETPKSRGIKRESKKRRALLALQQGAHSA
jgi:hypothetical protein